jgi:plastocyanin
MQFRFAAALCLVAVISPDASSVSAVRGVVRLGARPVADAVVWLDAPSAPARSHTRVVLDQRNSMFTPKVLAVQVGTRVDFPNNDRTFHNVFSFHNGKKFDLGLYPIGTTKRIVFDRPGLSRIFCNIHPQMAAYVVVVDSPYFAVTDADGRFTLGEVPDGTYAYGAWRAGAEPIAGSVEVRRGAGLEIAWP